MRRSVTALYSGVLAALAFLAVCMPAMAQEAKPTVRIAIVDAKLINDLYVKEETQTIDLEDWAKQQQAYLDELRNHYMYLGKDAFEEVLAFLRMPRPLPRNAAIRQKELRDVNDASEARYVELQSKLDRTPAEQDEFGKLQAGLEARENQIKAITSDLQRQLDDRQKAGYESVMAKVKDAITSLAQQGGYHLVLNKLVVVYGGDDITSDVLQKLTGKTVEELTAPGPAAGTEGDGE